MTSVSIALAAFFWTMIGPVTAFSYVQVCGNATITHTRSLMATSGWSTGGTAPGLYAFCFTKPYFSNTMCARVTATATRRLQAYLLSYMGSDRMYVSVESTKATPDCELPIMWPYRNTRRGTWKAALVAENRASMLTPTTLPPMTAATIFIEANVDYSFAAQVADGWSYDLGLSSDVNCTALVVALTPMTYNASHASISIPGSLSEGLYSVCWKIYANASLMSGPFSMSTPLGNSHATLLVAASIPTLLPFSLTGTLLYGSTVQLAVPVAAVGSFTRISLDVTTDLCTSALYTDFSPVLTSSFTNNGTHLVGSYTIPHLGYRNRGSDAIVCGAFSNTGPWYRISSNSIEVLQCSRSSNQWAQTLFTSCSTCGVGCCNNRGFFLPELVDKSNTGTRCNCTGKYFGKFCDKPTRTESLTASASISMSPSGTATPVAVSQITPQTSPATVHSSSTTTHAPTSTVENATCLGGTVALSGGEARLPYSCCKKPCSSYSCNSSVVNISCETMTISLNRVQRWPAQCLITYEAPISCPGSNATGNFSNNSTGPQAVFVVQPQAAPVELSNIWQPVRLPQSLIVYNYFHLRSSPYDVASATLEYQPCDVVDSWTYLLHDAESNRWTEAHQVAWPARIVFPGSCIRFRAAAKYIKTTISSVIVPVATREGEPEGSLRRQPTGNDVIGVGLAVEASPTSISLYRMIFSFAVTGVLIALRVWSTRTGR